MVQDGIETAYAYDALGQLIRVDDGQENATWLYTYDNGGNIRSKQKFALGVTTGEPLESKHFSYSNAAWRDQLTAVDGVAITYDAIGTPLSDGTWSYTWQNGRQLQKMQKQGETVEFVYNENGLRVQKTATSTGVTKYTLHGKNVVHMTSGTDELHFFYDAQNRPAVVVYNGVPYAYVKNLQGDVIAILDAAGNVVVSYAYDAWGAPIGKSGALAETLGSVQPFRYRGYVFDEETGLYYLRSRYYNPQWGRFVNADSIITSNLFAYCHNEPVQFVDFNGMLEQCGNKFSYKMISEGAGVGSSGSGGGGGILLLITEVIPDALSYIGRKFTDAVIGFTMLFAGEAAYIGDLCVPQPNPTPPPQSTPRPTPSPEPTPQIGQFYGARIIANQRVILTDSMNFEEAIAWVYSVGEMDIMGKSTAWGLYTEKQSNAFKIALALSASQEIINDVEYITGHYDHYHTSEHMFMGKYKHFHIWYGAPKEGT